MSVEDLEKAKKELEEAIKQPENQPGIIGLLHKSVDALTNFLKKSKSVKPEEEEEVPNESETDGEDLEEQDEQDEKEPVKKSKSEVPQKEQQDAMDTDEDGEPEGEDKNPKTPGEQGHEKGIISNKGEKKNPHKASCDDNPVPDEQGKEKGIITNKGKMAKSLEEPIDEEEIYKSLIENEDYVQVVEASEAMAHLTDVMAKSISDVSEGVVANTQAIQVLAESMVTLMKAQASILEQLEGFSKQPAAKQPHSGLVILNQPKGGEPMAKSALFSVLSKAVADKKLDGLYLSYFDTKKPEEILSLIPDGIKKDLGL
ncbi:MAG: hypothetical protein ACYCX4_01695 [Bacillota bacterium]